ncbi:MAG: T9SS type A sorting domain-containing protein [Cytophagales bacterium]|nr:T9SS type A sorting domain-containing protein [Cytophagales bacterium]
MVNIGGTGINENQPESIGINIYPNPYTGETQINYTLTEKADVILEVYNIHGKMVQPLANEMQSVGNYQYSFSARQVGYSSGVYILKLTVNDREGNSGKVYTRKLVEY